MLSEFLHWWARQLRDAVPAWLMASETGDAGRRLIASVEPSSQGPDRIGLQVRRGGRPVTLGPYTIDNAGIDSIRSAAAGQGAAVVRLQPGVMLEQQVALPLAAERDPGRVLQYEMDRMTPFNADELFWTWSIERRDRAQGRLHVLLSLVPKIRLAPVLDALAQAGLAATAVEAPGPGGTVRRIMLDRAAASPWHARGLAVAGGTCAILAVAAVAVPFVQQSAAQERVDRQIAALRPQVDQAEALRRRIQGAAAGSDVFADQRARVGDALGTIATLTDVLPDDTHLTELTMRARVITISGQSAGAARLIAALAAEPGLKNPAFAAPVTRFDGMGGEGFSIRAEVAP